MKFLIAIVLYRIERKLTPLLKTNLSVFANVFFSLNLFSSWIYFLGTVKDQSTRGDALS